MYCLLTNDSDVISLVDDISTSLVVYTGRL